MKPPNARAHWTSTRAPKWGVRAWSLLDFEMTTVPRLHEYWSSRDDQDMQLYLMKKMCAMNLLLQYHRACCTIVTHEQKEMEMSDSFVILIDA